MKGLAALVASQPLDSWKDYLRFHLIHDYADVLPRAFAEAAAGMRGDQRPRDQQALATTQSAMADAIGQLYAARYFSAAQKTRVNGIIKNVAAAFREARSGCGVVVAYQPAGSTGQARPAVRGHRIPGCVGRLERPSHRLHRRFWQRAAHRRPPVPSCSGPTRQAVRPARVGAATADRGRRPDLPAERLHLRGRAAPAPKYDSTASDAATYGAIGAIIGHDMSHFVDVLGADYEPDGRMRRWWTADDSARFEAAAEPIVRQFSAYQPLPGLNVDGRLTRTENVADLAGLTAAFEAYRKSLGAKAADRDYVRRSDREFFIAFAQSFGAKVNETDPAGAALERPRA